MIGPMIVRVKECPLCGMKLRIGNYRGHLRASVVVKGRNICPGMKEHPQFKKCESRRRMHEKGPRHLATVGLPSGAFRKTATSRLF